MNDTDLFLNITRRLSPIFATMHFFPCIINIIPQEPLGSIILPFSLTAFFVKNLSSVISIPIFIPTIENSVIFLCKLSFKKEEQPFPPWPS